jgi:hypothetical protein
MTKLTIALALLLSATTVTLAQSQRNYGANGPGRSGCYGEPYGGAVADRCPGDNGVSGGHRYWRHHY